MLLSVYVLVPFFSASKFLSKLNLSVGPCNDFYRFVCSNDWFGSDAESWPYRYTSIQHIYSAIEHYVTGETLWHRVADKFRTCISEWR